MRVMKKFFIVIAIILLVAGLSLFSVAFAMAGFKFSKLGTQKLEENTYTPDGEFENITIKVSTADIKFKPAEDGKLSVVCRELSRDKHEVEVKDGTLSIKNNDKRKWYDNISFFSKSPSVTVYLPEKDYKVLTIKTSTGDINMPSDFSLSSVTLTVSTGDVDFAADVHGDMNIKTSTGDVKRSGMTEGNFDITVSTGDILLKDSVTTGKLNIKTSTGDVRFDRSDAAEIKIKVSTGDVKGTLLSDKFFITKSSTGDIDVPNTREGGDCEITTSTGDIKISIAKSTEE